MSYEQELKDLRAVMESNAVGLVRTARNQGRIAWPGEDFTPPAPTGSGGSLVYWLDMDRGYGGQELLTQGGDKRRVINLDVGAMVQQGPDSDELAARLLDDVISTLTGRNTDTMHYWVETCYPTFEGIWQEVWWRRDLTVPIWREEA